MLIARVWHGLTRENLGNEYLHQLQELRVAGYQRTPGNRGVLVFQRRTSGVAEFLVISIWGSYEDVQRFTGSETVDTAIYHQEEYRYLLFPEPKVSHYELLAHGAVLLKIVLRAQQQTSDDQWTVEPAD